MRFLIVDDHPIMRFGVAEMLARHWPEATIDEAETLEAAVGLATREPPDAVVLDLSLPDASGVESAQRMLRVVRNAPVLVLSLNPESAYAARLLQMGVAGYLPKDRAREQLVRAVERLLQGRRYVTPELAEQLVGLLEGKSPGALPHEGLSAQEYRVMLLIAAGSTPAAIAQTMHLSVKTVGTYRARILAKGGWAHNIELTKYCLQHGLIPPT